MVLVTKLATCSLCHLLLGFGVGLLAKVQDTGAGRTLLLLEQLWKRV